MPKPSKQSKRRRLGKLRAELLSGPWAIDARFLAGLCGALEMGDWEAVQASLSFGNDRVEATSRIVNGIAVVPVTGVLRDGVDYSVRYGEASSYQLIERDFQQALANDQVRGVLFYFDTPGGSAIGCKRIADQIFAARGSKPLVGFVQTMCGSAGFYCAAACDRIEAVADSLVASIGTIFPHQEYSGMLEEFGIGAKVFTNSGSPKKGHGNIYEPLTKASTATLQAFIESYGSAFIADVARFRGTTPEQVIERYGAGDAMRADVAIGQGVVDRLVANFEETLSRMSAGQSSAVSGQQAVVSGFNSPPATNLQPNTNQLTTNQLATNQLATNQLATNQIAKKTTRQPISCTRKNTMNEKIKAQLFALGIVSSLDAPDAECKAALNAWFRAGGKDSPSDEAEILAALQAGSSPPATTTTSSTTETAAATTTSDSAASATAPAVTEKLQQAHDAEQAEARLADLKAAAKLVNEVAGKTVVTAEMVLAAVEKKLGASTAMKGWSEALAEQEKPADTSRFDVTGEGSDRYAADIVEAMIYRISNQPDMEITPAALQLVNRPLWAVAGECLAMAGQQVDAYGDREHIAQLAMEMGTPGMRHTFFSGHEGRQYIQASSPAARPGDFPNILSNLANKFLDTIGLDDDYSYQQVSAVLPSGLSDFKPALMINKGVIEELDELKDAEQFKDLGISEEVLSYIFLRRFGNRWGWTPVMVANDDMGAFVEGMLGLEEAWQVTQNRLVVDRFTANENLLDGSPLFANRADTGVGSNPATNNNDLAAGGAPSDTQWAAMETQYADIGGIQTGRRVRGSLNMCFSPTGGNAQEARRTFLPLNTGGLELKVANTTQNVGLYRGEVQVVTESELRVASKKVWYGLRNPTRLNTATIVRAYFNGFGTGGRRERWYDPTNKTTYVSIEGRIAVAVKNWRYAVRNAGQ